MKRVKLTLVAAALAAVFLWSRRARAAPGYDFGIDVRYPDPGGEPWAEDYELLGVGLSNVPSGFPVPEPLENEMSGNLNAFLYMIRRAEHSASHVNDNSDYQIAYGGRRFTGMNDHPTVTGELRGYPLTPEQCRNAGRGPGCVSTAAGAYQFLAQTWIALRDQYPALPDFSPASQDEAARRLLARMGALKFVEAGQLDDAVRAASPSWESLTYATAKQNPKSLATLAQYYAQAGGALA